MSRSYAERIPAQGIPIRGQTGRSQAPNRKGGLGGRPELSLVENDQVRTLQSKFRAPFGGCQEGTHTPTKLRCGPGETRLTTSKVRT